MGLCLTVSKDRTVHLETLDGPIKLEFMDASNDKQLLMRVTAPASVRIIRDEAKDKRSPLKRHL